MLVKHLSALGLYFISTIINVVVLCINYIVLNGKTNDKLNFWFNFSLIMINVLSAVSQLVVCWIFWNLATNEALPESDRHSEV